MTGAEFAKYLNKYQKLKNLNIRQGIVKSNPAQSKHLETVTLNLFNLDIDIVHLRNETYTNTSRIPNIEIGTPLIDALRRDFTINSLFYNINNDKIEDYTKKGLLDLNNQILRTPIDPFITFKEDPLRILRAIRFAIQFNLKLDNNIILAASNINISNY